MSEFMHRYVTLLSVATLLLISSATLLTAQGNGRNALDLPDVTRALAIRNVRIVVRPGTVIERGDVVVRNGLIEAVGSGIPIPYDARIVDAEGLTLYPGFIDGYGHAGLKEPEASKDSIKRPGDPPPSRAGITPERAARDLLDPHDARLDSLRRIGFTAAHLVPEGGMLPGQGAIVLLGGRKPAEMILSGDYSLAASFNEMDAEVYPATPMGMMAKLRELFRRAAQFTAWSREYNASPVGAERPRYDAVLDALQIVVEDDAPVLFEVSNDLQTRRALLLSDELGFRPILAGMKGGWDVAEIIGSRNVPLFFSLDFPAPSDDTASAGSSDSTALLASPRPDSSKRLPPVTEEEARRVQERTRDYQEVPGERNRLTAVREEATRLYRGAPAWYHQKKVTFGFSTNGAVLGKVRDNLREAVANGLPADAALAALTIDGARLLGLEKTLGSVEKGKIANLLVTSGPYFDDTTKVRMVVVDGLLYDFTDEEGDGEKKDSSERNDGTESDRSTPVRLTALNAGPPYAPGRLAAMRRDTSGNILVRNATVLTVTKGTIENADVLVRDGKISAVGKGLGAPSGAQVIDGTGKFVMPGIIDAHSHIAVSGEVNEWTNPVTAEVRIEDVLDPYDISIYRALAGGVTTSHTMHGSANAIGGQCETIKHRWGEIDPEKIKMAGAPRTIKFALGENPTRVHGRGFGVQPSTRMGVEQVFRKTFTEAQRYMKEWDEYEAGDAKAAPPQYDIRLEAMADILRGEILIHCHSYRADEILMLMEVLKDFGIEKITFQHVNEGFKVAPELAEFGAMASVFSDWWSYKFEVYYSTAYNAAILTRNGVVTSINSDSPELNRHLYHEAAKTMHYGGLTEEEALSLITINPAKQLGVEDRIGSIEVGKEGDLAIFDAHPLSIYARPVMTIVDGVIRFDAENDPDDMRLYVDPKEKLDAVRIFREHDDRCMQGVKE